MPMCSPCWRSRWRSLVGFTARTTPRLPPASVTSGPTASIRKDYTAAQPILEKALAIRRRIYSADHPLIADACSKLALNYSAGETRRRSTPS